MSDHVVLDGERLTVTDVIAVARNHTSVAIAPQRAARLSEVRRAVEEAAAGPDAVYGLNTGFGKLASVKIAPDQLTALQRNLIVSHASGVGPPLPVEMVRAIMLLRINVLLKETSGVRPELPERLAAMLNAGLHPVVPEQGSVGASGDLAPLSHVGLGLMGGGQIRRSDGQDPEPAGDALRAAGIAPIVFGVKEGLAFINGTQVQTAALSLLVHDASALWRNAHAAAALSIEALKGTPDPFDARLHNARPHAGQLASASLLRTLLDGSQIRESHRAGDVRVQDAYSMRCTPQILGPVWDTLEYARRVVDVELNAATDNPLVVDGELISGGNFHGQPVAMALDYVTIALTTLANLAERRLERILNPDLSPGLPAFLAAQPGLESGLMMVQIVAAALAGECRALSTPASVQSIPTDANQEDYVPMGMAAASKARRVFDNARRVVACELVSGAQGLEHHRPLRSAPQVERVYAWVRERVAPLTGDRSLTDDLERVADAVGKEAIV
jgi:histidine ammonia-lyase